MKKHLCLSMALLGLFLIAGCKKSNNTISTSSVYLPSSYANTTCKFDDKNRMIEFNQGVDYKLIYDSSDRLTEVDGYNGTTIYRKVIYTYNTGSITEQEIDYTNGSPIAAGTVTITLNSAQKPIKRDFGTAGYFTFTYDNAGNVATYGSYSASGGLIDVHTFTYDNKNSWLLNVKGNFHVFLTLLNELTNNMLTDTLTDNTNNSSTTTYSNYKYNADGYPASRAMTVTYIVNGISNPSLTTGPINQTFTYVTN